MPFNYFGQKRGTAHTYQAPRHRNIIEPFAGAAHYGIFWLLEEPWHRLILFDTDELVIETWERFLTATPDDILSWILLPGDPINDYIDQANAAGDPRPRASGRTPAMFQKQLPRLANIRARLNTDNIRIHHGDYTHAINGDATWFIDPPYQHQGHWYRHNTIDYTHLAEWSQKRHGQVIVCEAEPADWLPFRPHRRLVNQAGDTTTELVWTSEPDDTLFDIEGLT